MRDIYHVLILILLKSAWGEIPSIPVMQEETIYLLFIMEIKRGNAEGYTVLLGGFLLPYV
jgi:hypothetical protein